MVAPLDWGLGHATRCIPIIRQLIALNCEVLIAGSGASKLLLEKEFPGIRSLELPGYGLKYGKKSWSTHVKLFVQIPKILTAIKRENRWLTAFLAREPLDLLISDNRYGLHADGLFSVIMTHQLCIQTPLGSGPAGTAAEKRLQSLHYRFINRFSRCWVPDFETGPTLAGKLSHPETLPDIDTRYIGILSRFCPDAGIEQGMSRERGLQDGMDIDILFLLSGPEPQRTVLEKKVIRELQSFTGRAVLVRGLPGKKQAAADGDIERDINGNSGIAPGSFGSADVSVYSHLSTAELLRILIRTELVVSRAGYSTIMDLVVLRKKAILIPTPGQTEQEYLGDRLRDLQIFPSLKQRKFSLAAVLTAARRFRFEGFAGYAAGSGREGNPIDVKKLTEGALAGEIRDVLKTISRQMEAQ